MKKSFLEVLQFFWCVYISVCDASLHLYGIKIMLHPVINYVKIMCLYLKSKLKSCIAKTLIIWSLWHWVKYDFTELLIAQKIFPYGIYNNQNLFQELVPKFLLFRFQIFHLSLCQPADSGPGIGLFVWQQQPTKSTGRGLQLAALPSIVRNFSSVSRVQIADV